MKNTGILTAAVLTLLLLPAGPQWRPEAGTAPEPADVILREINNMERPLEDEAEIFRHPGRRDVLRLREPRRITSFRTRTPTAFSSIFFPERPVLGRDAAGRAREAERIMFRNLEWHNYELLLREAGPSSLPGANPGDILLKPGIEEGVLLHPDLLEKMYDENMRRVFFVVELSPYYSDGRHNRVPWLRGRTYFYFGNSFWLSADRIENAYRRVYGNAGTDFNSQMRRVERYNRMEEKPMVLVFARLERTGAATMWRNAWGWRDYYYFTGEDIIPPRN